MMKEGIKIVQINVAILRLTNKLMGLIDYKIKDNMLHKI